MFQYIIYQVNVVSSLNYVQSLLNPVEYATTGKRKERYQKAYVLEFGEKKSPKDLFDLVQDARLKDDQYVQILHEMPFARSMSIGDVIYDAQTQQRWVVTSNGFQEF